MASEYSVACEYSRARLSMSLAVPLKRLNALRRTSVCSALTWLKYVSQACSLKAEGGVPGWVRVEGVLEPVGEVML